MKIYLVREDDEFMVDIVGAYDNLEDAERAAMLFRKLARYGEEYSIKEVNLEMRDED